MCRARPSRRGFTLFQLILLLAILLLLLGMLPLAVLRVRQAAARAQGQNNLHQLTLALQNCADTHQGLLPPVVGAYPVDAAGGGEGTLHFHILPYIEQQNVYNLSNDANEQRYRVSFQNTAAFKIPTYLAKNDPSAPPGNVYDGWLALCNYPANYLVFQQGGSRFPATITDGTSNTIFFAERYQMCNGQPHAWGYDGLYYWTPMFEYYSLEPFQVLPPPNECDPERPQGLEKGGINVGLGDGSVRFVSSQISAQTWYFACTPNGGEVLGADW